MELIRSKGEAGECLPEGHYCNANGYLRGPGPTLRSLDPCVLEAKIQFVWTDHLRIAIFIGPRPKLGFLQPWLEAHNSETEQGKVSFNHEVVGAHILLSQV